MSVPEPVCGLRLAVSPGGQLVLTCGLPVVIGLLLVLALVFNYLAEKLSPAFPVCGKRRNTMKDIRTRKSRTARPLILSVVVKTVGTLMTGIAARVLLLT